MDKYKYVLVANTYHPGMQKNIDIEMGDYRPLDLRLPPFNVQAEPVYVINRQPLPPIVVFLITKL